MPYSRHRRGGTVSFWLNLSPEKDLEPGFCDPIQITDTTYDDAALWVDFSAENPSDRGGGRATLYLNGERQGTSELIMEPFTWNTAKCSIRLGQNYVGGFDELALFDRTFTADQVKRLFELRSSLKKVLPSGD